MRKLIIILFLATSFVLMTMITWMKFQFVFMDYSPFNSGNSFLIEAIESGIQDPAALDSFEFSQKGNGE